MSIRSKNNIEINTGTTVFLRFIFSLPTELFINIFFQFYHQITTEIINITEGMMADLFGELLNIELEFPFKRILYDDALDRYGLDKPDIRFGLELKDISDIG